MSKSTGRQEEKAIAVEAALKEYTASIQLRDRTIAQARSRNAETVKKIAKKHGVSLMYIRTIYRAGQDETQ
jgi:thiamine monophosphate synthase